MKAIVAIATFALAAVATSASAASRYSSDEIRMLAESTGLSERQVEMIVAPRTPYANHPYLYDRGLEYTLVLKKFERALGKESAGNFIAGKKIDFPLVQRTAALND